jgi:hypothetical protein
MSLNPSSVAVQCKCKLCGKVIGHFAMSYPADEKDSNAGFNAGQFKALSQAMPQHMVEEARSPRPSLTESTKQANQRIQAQHAAALQHASMMGGNVQILFVSRHFELPPAAQAFFEDVRASINHMTESFTLTEEYAEQITTAVMCIVLADTYDVTGSRFDQQTFCGTEPAPMPTDLLPSDWKHLNPVKHAAVKSALLALAARYEQGHPKMGDPKAN